MAAYNSIDNVHCVVNPWLLTDLLRKTWGFRGHVVSDCSAVPGAPGAIQALKAGLDLECGGNFRSLAHAVTTGAVTEEEINNALHHVLEVRFRLGLFDPPDKVPFSNIPMSDVESPEHLELARQVARESIVLLKNDGILPLDKSKLKRIAVVGPNADATNMLNGNYNGKPTHPVNILQGIRAEVGTGVEVTFSKGCPLIVRQGDPKWKGSPDFQNAVETTKSADVIIFVGGIDATIEGEESKLEAVGFAHGDRTRIDLPEPQETLLQALRATGKPVIFINCTGSAVAMPWEAANLSGILQAWYPGVEGGAAVADILFGNYNPAGRLPITFYEKTEDLPEFIDYRMANRTYRYFTGKVLFPFGYGLSYTTFQYGPITPSASSLSAANTLHISVPVQNTGSRDGDEVVQVYLKHLGSSVPQPIRSLVAFRRVPISAGASSPVAFDIPVERFHYWDVVKKAYVVEPGTYEIEVGASSSDIRQTCQLSVK